MQTIQDGFQHEQPDYWLNFGNPWEIERLNIAYTIKFYGHVSVQDEGGRQTFKWNPGESVSQHSSVKTRVPSLNPGVMHTLSTLLSSCWSELTLTNLVLHPLTICGISTCCVPTA